MRYLRKIEKETRRVRICNVTVKNSLDVLDVHPVEVIERIGYAGSGTFYRWIPSE